MIQVRKFLSGDEEAVRQICFDTALFGDSIAPHFGDRRLVSDALLGCFLRCAPDWLYVAEEDASVIGYLAGSLDAQATHRQCAVWLGLSICRDWIIGGHALKPRSLRLARDAFRYAGMMLRLRSRAPESCAATLHVNVHRNHRGSGVGTALIHRYLHDLTAVGARGVHLSTASPAARVFFSTMGFTVLASALSPPIAGCPPRDVWLMIRELP